MQHHQTKVGPVWTQAKVDLPLLSADGRAVQLVVRLDGQLKHLPKAVLQQKILTLLQLWQQQGVKVTQLELDYDCASSQLGAYANWINELRQALPQTLALSITALPDWLGKPGWHELQQQADQLGVVPEPRALIDEEPYQQCDADKDADGTVCRAFIGLEHGKSPLLMETG